MTAPEASTPAEIAKDATWHFIIGGEEGEEEERNSQWVRLPTRVLVGSAEENVYSQLWRHRSISHLPENASSHFALRNGIIMPALGELS